MVCLAAYTRIKTIIKPHMDVATFQQSCSNFTISLDKPQILRTSFPCMNSSIKKQFYHIA